MNAAIIDFLKSHGDCLDSEIAAALKMSRSNVANELAQLSTAGDIICCKVIRYVDGKEIAGVSCRLSGSLPKAAPGPKIGASRNTSMS